MVNVTVAYGALVFVCIFKALGDDAGAGQNKTMKTYLFEMSTKSPRKNKDILHSFHTSVYLNNNNKIIPVSFSE